MRNEARIHAQKQRGIRGLLILAFFSVIRVIEPDANDLGRPRKRREKIKVGHVDITLRFRFMRESFQVRAAANQVVQQRGAECPYTLAFDHVQPLLSALLELYKSHIDLA
jgi:hypothetical protein